DHAPGHESEDHRADGDDDGLVDPVADLLVLDGDARHEGRVDAVRVVHLIEEALGLAASAQEACGAFDRVLVRGDGGGALGDALLDAGGPTSTALRTPALILGWRALGRRVLCGRVPLARAVPGRIHRSST